MIGRYELKFPLMDAATQQKFLELAQKNLKQDAYGNADACYRVSSQYFDTADYRAYWEKQDGQAIRQKIRLRYYSVGGVEGSSLVAYMEIKHRIDNRVYKERVKLSPAGAEAILSDSKELCKIADHVAPEDRDKQSTLDNLLSAAKKPGFKAVNVITYMREAWVGDQDDGLRVTFDSSCRSTLPQDFLDVSSSRGVAIHEEGKMIMEIKFNHGIPRWIRDIVGNLGLDLQRFSKYASGLEALDLVPLSKTT